MNGVGGFRPTRTLSDGSNFGQKVLDADRTGVSISFPAFVERAIEFFTRPDRNVAPTRAARLEGRFQVPTYYWTSLWIFHQCTLLSRIFSAYKTEMSLLQTSAPQIPFPHLFVTRFCEGHDVGYTNVTVHY